MNQQAASSDTASSDADEISRGLEQIRLEEARIVEAYRLAILTPEQLARELETLKNRRELLESKKMETRPFQLIPEVILKGSVSHACKLLTQRLGTLDFSGRQNLLRTLLTKVVFEGNRVRLIGSLPLERDGETDNAGRIVTTTSSDCGHNLDGESLIDTAPSHADASELNFEITRPMLGKRPTANRELLLE